MKIVAEMSCNHLGSFDRAMAIVEAAAKAGADAVKLQTWNQMAIAGYYSGKSLPKLYEEIATPWDWIRPIFERCKELGMFGFSAPFDFESVEFLETVGCPIYKIASFEIVDLPLIRSVAETKKPMIISTGMATQDEIYDAVHTAKHWGCSDITLLKCTSAYPSTPDKANLATMVDMQRCYRTKVGLSDHTLGIGVAVAASALGAEVVEKHLTLSRSDGGPDSAFSMEPEEFTQLVTECRNAKQALGTVQYGPTDGELTSYRRSLWITEDVEAGEYLTLDNVTSLRPADGLPPKFLSSVVGRIAKNSINKGTPLCWDLLVP